MPHTKSAQYPYMIQTNMQKKRSAAEAEPTNCFSALSKERLGNRMLGQNEKSRLIVCSQGEHNALETWTKKKISDMEDARAIYQGGEQTIKIFEQADKGK